ncbi:18550_t:CDS:1 [Acaulospora morrowiae]|uniref:18550_t:CDS:1 n=1 Tax=Acaulospora morrowiae TaxID=94023 RepID=A0A9N9FVT3_9GLOM|nr:18550_t:CDS:1 [Acaulospora morrowiae]
MTRAPVKIQFSSSTRSTNSPSSPPSEYAGTNHDVGKNVFSNSIAMNVDAPTIIQHTIPYPLALDCLINVFEYLKDDRATLYSCVMVNRVFSQLAIPLLWRRPFENQLIGKQVNIIQTYISCLAFKDKEALINHDISLPDMANPLFDYPRYLRGFDSENFNRSIEDWLMMLWDIVDSEFPIKVKVLNKVIGNLLFSRTTGLRVLKIDRGEIEDTCLMNITTFFGNYRAFENLEKFELKFDNDDEERWPLNIDHKARICTQLSLFTRSLKYITITIDPYRWSPPSPTVCTPIFQLIESQKGLEFLEMEEFWEDFAFSLEFYLALQNQTHALTHLTLKNLSQFDLLLRVLVNCTSLETLEFLKVPESNSESLVFAEHKRNSSLIKPLSIKKLISYDAKSDPDLVTQTLSIIVRMANRNLRALMIFEVTPELLDVMGECCPNIMDLYLTMSTSSIFNLIPYLSTLPLEYLFLWEDHSLPFSTEFVRQVAHSLPPTLKNLEITFDLTPRMLATFLEECPANFRELVLRADNSNDEFLRVVIDYAKMRGVRLKCLKLWGLGTKYSVSMVEEAKRYIPKIVNLASYPLW